MTNYLMQMLEKKGIPTHFVKQLSDTDTVVKRVKIIPLEVIVRNIAAGSLAKRLGLEEGTKFKEDRSGILATSAMSLTTRW